MIRPGAATSGGRLTYSLLDFTPVAGSGTVSTAVISAVTYRTATIATNGISYDGGSTAAPRFVLALPAGSRRVRVLLRVRQVTGAIDGYSAIVCGWYADAAAPGTFGAGGYQIASYAMSGSANIGSAWNPADYPGSDIVVGGLGGSTASTTWMELDFDLFDRSFLLSLGTGSGETPPTAWSQISGGRLDINAGAMPDLGTPGSLVIWHGRPNASGLSSSLTLALDARVEIDA